MLSAGDQFRISQSIKLRVAEVPHHTQERTALLFVLRAFITTPRGMCASPLVYGQQASLYNAIVSQLACQCNHVNMYAAVIRTIPRYCIQSSSIHLALDCGPTVSADVMDPNASSYCTGNTHYGGNNCTVSCNAGMVQHSTSLRTCKSTLIYMLCG